MAKTITLHVHTDFIERHEGGDKPFSVNLHDGSERVIATVKDDTISIQASVHEKGDTAEFELAALLDKLAAVARSRSDEKDKKLGVNRPTATQDGKEFPVRMDLRKS